MWNPFDKKKIEPKLENEDVDEYVYADSSAYDALTFGDNLDIFAYNVGNAAIPSSTFLRVIALITGKCSELIVNSLTVIDKKGQPATPLKLTSLNNDLLTESPDGGQPGYNFISDCFRDLLVAGNCLIVVKRNTADKPIELTRILPNTATSYNTPDGLVYFGQESYGVKFKQYSEDEVIHASWPLRRDDTQANYNRGRFSFAPVRLLRKTISTAVDADKHVYNYFRSNMNLVRANIMADKEQELTKKQYQKLNASLGRIKTSFFLPVRRLEAISPVNIDAQTETLKQLRIFQNEEIARVYGVPLSLLGMANNAVAGTHTELSRHAWRYCFSLHINYLLKAMEHKLLPKGYRYYVDPSALVKGEFDSMTALMQFVGGSQNPGVITVNEARKKLGFNTLDDPKYDELYEFVPANQPKQSNNGENEQNNGNNS